MVRPPIAYLLILRFIAFFLKLTSHIFQILKAIVNIIKDNIAVGICYQCWSIIAILLTFQQEDPFAVVDCIVYYIPSPQVSIYGNSCCVGGKFFAFYKWRKFSHKNHPFSSNIIFLLLCNLSVASMIETLVLFINKKFAVLCKGAFAKNSLTIVLFYGRLTSHYF